MGNVLRYLEDSYGRYPEKCAVTDERRSYTYREFYGLSRRVGSALARRTGRGQAVGIYMEKNADAVAAFFGVQWAGCFYSVLNTELPGSRLNQIVEQLEPPVIVTCRELLPQAEEIFPGRNLCCFEDLAREEEDGEALAAIQARAIDTDPLYVNFTSGSTGVPKGIVVCSRSVLDFIDCFTELFHITKDDVIANQAPFDFDVSVKDIYSAMKVGATLAVVPRALFSRPTELIDFLCEKKATTLIWRCRPCASLRASTPWTTRPRKPLKRSCSPERSCP